MKNFSGYKSPPHFCKYFTINFRSAKFHTLKTHFESSSLYTITVLNFLRIYFFNLYKPFSSVAYTVSVNEL